MYSRARTNDDNTRFSITVLSKVDARATFEKKPIRELSQANRHGDTFRRDIAGQVTYFRYCHSNRSLSFCWDSQGHVSTIDSSDGWSWTRVQESHFNGWLVRNYFDSWTVSSDQCQCVKVTEDGVSVSGVDACMMGLPVRP